MSTGRAGLGTSPRCEGYKPRHRTRIVNHTLMGVSRGKGTQLGLSLAPVDFGQAKAFIAKHHRHHLPPSGWKWGVAALDSGVVVGVITVGRPVARKQDDGWTLEVTRCCTDGTKNACSFLYAAAWRAGQAQGYRRMITYTLEEEQGASLRAANWQELRLTESRTWNSPSRPRVDKSPPSVKRLWQAPGSVETRQLGAPPQPVPPPTPQPTFWDTQGG